MRLDKFLRERGISRRQTRELIAAGRVLHNGIPALCAAEDCDERSTVLIDGKPLGPARPLYLMLHKPPGVVTAVRDPEQTVMDLLPAEYRERGLFPVGRLDKASEGMLLLTNDGEWCTRILAPESHLPKTYWIRVGRPFPPDTEKKFQEGIRFPNGTVCRPAQITVAPDRQSATVTITEGKTHQVRRMAAACGVRVQTLRRLSIGGLTMENTLEPGQCRELTSAEFEQLFSETE